MSSNSNMHKTIFHTTEKSNFILNMSNDQFNKFASVSLCIGFIIIFIVSVITELLSNSQVGTIKTGSLNELAYDWRILPSFALALTGLLGASIFIIALIKQTLTKKQIAASVIVLAMLIFMYISYVNAFTDVLDYSAFLGYRYGRYEGFMTYLSYLFIFLGAVSINSRSAVKRIFDTFIIIMVLECIWSGLQLIPSFPSFYHEMPYVLDNHSLPSGVTGSPVFLAALLTTGLSVSIMGAIFDKNKKRAAFYNISTLLSSFFLIYTHTLTGFISFGIIMIICICVVIVNNKKKEEKKSFVPCLIMLGGSVAALIIMLITGFRILDGAIIWHDGCRRLNSFGQYTKGTFDINDITSLYPYLWDKALVYINKFPVTGIGPDSFIIPDMDLTGAFAKAAPLSFDRPYNEYLFYAATLGIPFCITFITALIYSVINAVRSSSECLRGKGSWIHIAALTGTISYILISIINCGTATITPFIWLILGISCCTLKEKETK